MQFKIIKDINIIFQDTEYERHCIHSFRCRHYIDFKLLTYRYFDLNMLDMMLNIERRILYMDSASLSQHNRSAVDTFRRNIWLD